MLYIKPLLKIFVNVWCSGETRHSNCYDTKEPKIEITYIKDLTSKHSNKSYFKINVRIV